MASRVQHKLMANGWWSLDLDRVPQVLLKALMDNLWGEVYFTKPAYATPFHTKTALKAVSVFTGVLWQISRDPTTGTMEISGPSNAVWLGDAGKNRGAVRKTMLEFTAEPIVGAVTALLPTSVTAGTIQAPSGSTFINTRHYLETPRASIQTIADLTSGEWRVNPNGTMDFGDTAQLGYVSTPQALVFPRTVGMEAFGMQSGEKRLVRPSKIQVVLDVEDYITEALLAGEGAGQTIVLGEATSATIPYNDPNGNELIWREVYNEPLLTIAEGDNKAAVYVDDHDELLTALTLGLKEFVVGGTYAVGDWIYVYDPPMLQDLGNPIAFGASFIYPAATRLVGVDWPVIEGFGAYFRDHTNTIWDLTPYIVWSVKGEPSLEVGAFKRSAINTSLAATVAQGRAVTSSDDDTLAPAAPVDFAWDSQGTHIVNGVSRAWMKFDWTTVTTNSDGSVLVDATRYKLRYQRSDVLTAGGDYKIVSDIEYGVEEFTIYDLALNKEWKVALQLVDLHGNRSVWSDTVTHDSPSSPGPSKPALPTVVGVGSAAIRVTHSLNNSVGADLEEDTVRLLVYIDTQTPVRTVGDDGLAAQSESMIVTPEDISSGRSLTKAFTQRGTGAFISNLVRGNTYYVAVLPINQEGTQGSTISDTSALVHAGNVDTPNPPTSLSAADGGIVGQMGKVVLNWVKSTSNDVAQYEIKWKRSNVTRWSNSEYVPGTDSELVIENLIANREYSFRIRAISVHGNQSTWSATVTQRPGSDLTGPDIPPQPTLTAVPGGFDISFDLTTWGPANLDAKYIRVYAGTTPNPTQRRGKVLLDYEDDLLAGGTVTFEWRPGVLVAAEYYARGKAFDWCGNPSQRTV